MRMFLVYVYPSHRLASVETLRAPVYEVSWHAGDKKSRTPKSTFYRNTHYFTDNSCDSEKFLKFNLSHMIQLQFKAYVIWCGRVRFILNGRILGARTDIGPIFVYGFFRQPACLGICVFC